MKYIKVFNNHSNYETYINDNDKVLPNVSYCKNNNEIHYNKWYDPIRLVAKFNVSSNSISTHLINNPTLLKEIEIDGNVLPNVVNSYQFDTTGIHTVKFTLNDNITSIGGDSFAGILQLISITIPEIITTIGDGAFASCIRLKSVRIPNTVTSIGVQSFFNCNLSKIFIPSSVINISNSFTGNNLYFEDLIFESINPNATFILDTTNKVLLNNNGQTLTQGFNNIINIPNTVTTIGSNAFYKCKQLRNITIPDSVTTIGTDGFYGCSSLTSITSLAPTEPTIQSNTFSSIKTNGTLYVPSGSSGYNVWMSTVNFYLGSYNWTKIEQ